MAVAASEWLPYQARVSLFRASVGPFHRWSVTELYQVEPEISQTSGPNKDYLEVGSLGVGKIQVISTVSRVDVIWAAQVTPSEMPMLGDLADVFEVFLKPLEERVKECAWARVALGLHVGCQVEDRISGYSSIARRLKDVALDGENTRDFLYQINRFKQFPLGSDSVLINRVTKWAVSRIGIAQLTAELTSGNVSNELVTLLVAGVEMDFNSAAEFARALSGDESWSILQDSAAHAIDITTGTA